MGFGKKSGNEKWHFCYEVHEKNSSNRNATGYKWVLVTCWASTNTHLYHVALRFDEFFHEIFKPPQITNGNLILAVLLVESNTMHFLYLLFFSIFVFSKMQQNTSKAKRIIIFCGVIKKDFSRRRKGNIVTMFENFWKCRIWIFQCWHFPSIFVHSKSKTLLVSLAMLSETFLWFSNTVICQGKCELRCHFQSRFLWH